MHLETERLLMPPLSGRHTGALTEVYADPDVARHIGAATLDADGTAAQVARFEAVWPPPRLTAVIDPDNAASRALVTRLGFRVHREDVTSSGVRVLVHELAPAG